MGIVWSLLSSVWSFSSTTSTAPADADNVIDPVTGLSGRQKRIIRQTWALVRADLKSAGVGFFVAFFTAHPEYQLKFKGFAKVPLDELAGNARVQAHALNVMYAITLLVDSLDDVSCLVEQLKTLGANHIRRDVQIVHFQNLSVVLVDFLGSALGKQFDEEARQSWTAVLNVMNSVIDQGLQH